MNSGPSATLGIMFSVTNSGSSSRLTSGDQQNSTASVMPTKAPSAKPPRISIAVTARLDNHAYFAEVSVATVASGEGNMNFGTASRAEIHIALAARHRRHADLGEIRVVVQSRRDGYRNSRRLCARRLRRHHTGGAVLLVAAGEPAAAAAVRYAEHDSQGGA